MISRDMPSANAYLSGSTISDSKIGGHVYCRTTANTVNKDITAADYMNYCFCANDASVDLIKNNIAVSGISYWNGEWTGEGYDKKIVLYSYGVYCGSILQQG